jgi:hypothetical protein
LLPSNLRSLFLSFELSLFLAVVVESSSCLVFDSHGQLPHHPFSPLPARFLICSADFLLHWPRVASVWSAPGSSLVMTLPPSHGPTLISRCCFYELGAGPIQSPMNPWLPVGAVKAESCPFLTRASAVTSAQVSLNFSHTSTVLGVRSLASDSQWIFLVGSMP